MSFDRPYGRESQYTGVVNDPLTVGSGEFLPFEFPLAYWLEQHGYDVSYCSNSDMLTPDRGLKCKAFLSVGHDEYWDIRQYRSVEKMRDAGVNLLFLSGNSVCWVTPFRASSDGQPNRIIFRGGPYGGDLPHAKERADKNGPFPERGPDEGFLMGARNVDPVNGGGDWICAKPEHWIFEGTGMKKGDVIPGLIGWEYHGDPARHSRPGSRRRRHRVGRRCHAAALDRDDLSRAERQLRLQRLDHLLGAGPLASRPATCCPGRTGAARTAPTNACNA